jgi:hypothetical protein
VAINSIRVSRAGLSISRDVLASAFLTLSPKISKVGEKARLVHMSSEVSQGLSSKFTSSVVLLLFTITGGRGVLESRIDN